jgi:type II secretory ATPase GspE/PulE/Tfp pilus assembly ATPase PilB-like protein
MLQRLREISGRGQGLILVSGRPGTGVTSTLYSLLREQDAFIKQLVTLEQQVEVDLENITQNKYANAADLPGRLASALRLDPDVVMVDECENEKAAATINEAAQRILILLGVKAADTFQALAKWVKLAGPEGMNSLQAVLCQVLVRKLCPECREAYTPDPSMLAKANLPSKKIERFYRPPTKPLTDEKGNEIVCHACRGTGYIGRTAVFELLEVTDEIRQLVATGQSVSQIKAACRKNKMLYLQEQALRKVIQGVTSVQEVVRVSQKPQKPQKPSGKPGKKPSRGSQE